MRVIASIFLGAALLFSAGCISVSHSPRMIYTGDPVVDNRNGVNQAPAKDKVLWQYQLAAACMRTGRYGEAKMALDDSLALIGGALSNSKDARRSRGYFARESKKTFIGEPYERVMAYFYRGILYWMDGEPDNARACFRSAQIQDSDTENKSYASDYVLLDYLDGLITARLGGDGSDCLKRARASAKLSTPPDYDKQANVFIFSEFGKGPTKFATGEYNEQLRFRTVESSIKKIQIRMGTQLIQLAAMDDLNFQATTRGGRAMDHVLGNKAVFKKVTDVAGNVAIVAGAVTAIGTKSQEAGLAMIAAGLVSTIISGVATPEADTRSWNNLPQYLTFVSLRLPPGQHPATVDFLDASGRAIPGLSREIIINTGTKDEVLFISATK